MKCLNTDCRCYQRSGLGWVFQILGPVQGTKMNECTVDPEELQASSSICCQGQPATEGSAPQPWPLGNSFKSRQEFGCQQALHGWFSVLIDWFGLCKPLLTPHALPLDTSDLNHNHTQICTGRRWERENLFEILSDDTPHEFKSELPSLLSQDMVYMCLSRNGEVPRGWCWGVKVLLFKTAPLLWLSAGF